MLIPVLARADKSFGERGRNLFPTPRVRGRESFFRGPKEAWGKGTPGTHPGATCQTQNQVNISTPRQQVVAYGCLSQATTHRTQGDTLRR